MVLERQINYNRKVVAVRIAQELSRFYILQAYCFVAEVRNTESVRLGKLNFHVKNDAVKAQLTLR